MRARAVVALTVLAAAGATAAISVVRATDHLDGPRTTADPAADIADVFAFTSPEDPSKVVLAITVNPYASDAAAFSSDVDYAFRVQRVAALQPLTLEGTGLDVTCTVAAADGAPPVVTCAGPGGASASAPVGQTAPAAGPMRVFAGLRADPAFFDRQGVLATVASGRASFTGQNAFAGANVLAIVVEVDAALFARSAGPGAEGGAEAGVEAGAPVLAVAAETVRRSS
jgi:hypothetical protein